MAKRVSLSSESMDGPQASSTCSRQSRRAGHFDEEPVAIASAVGDIHPADTPVAMPSAGDKHTAETPVAMPSAVGDGYMTVDNDEVAPAVGKKKKKKKKKEKTTVTDKKKNKSLKEAKAKKDDEKKEAGPLDGIRN